MIVFIILSSHGDNYFEDRLVATLTVQNWNPIDASDIPKLIHNTYQFLEPLHGR
jgi:hypothetical protein